MDEIRSSKEQQPKEKESYSRDDVIEMLSKARVSAGIHHPDDLDPDDPAVKAFEIWQDQGNPYTKELSPEAAESSWGLDKTMIYFDAGFDDPDYLDELGELLYLDLDEAEEDSKEKGMSGVIGAINHAIKRVEARLG